MRIIIHDRPGYALSVELSRELAWRGHDVLHLYDGYFQSPKGLLEKQADDSPRLTIRELKIRQPLQKYSFAKRWFQEREYGHLVARQIKSFQPDVIVSANTPPDAQMIIFNKSRKANIKFVSWVHDIHGLAIKKFFRKKYWFAGDWLGSYYLQKERKIIAQSHQVILITKDFIPLMKRWHIDRNHLYVIPNWAPIRRIPVRPKNNQWSKIHNVVDKFCFLYAGTLGLKHNPNLLLQLALHFKEDSKVQVMVASEGLGAIWLQKQKDKYELRNLSIIPYQPLNVFPDVLAAADVLVAILTPDAGTYSVPSKVLSYLCAQRPVLVAIPADNLAARIIADNKAGMVTSAVDVETFIASAETLYKNQDLRNIFAVNARAYAQKHFNLSAIADKFEQILTAV